MAGFALMSCAHKTHYESVDEYPVKKGSVREVFYTPNETTFTLWSPNADSVVLNLYTSSEGGEPIRTQHLVRRVDGAWETAVVGDLKGLFYTFRVVQADSRWKLHENPGIFAVAVGVNGRRGAIVDLKETNPEGWANDVRPANAAIQVYGNLLPGEERLLLQIMDHILALQKLHRVIGRFVLLEAAEDAEFPSRRSWRCQ